MENSRNADCASPTTDEAMVTQISWRDGFGGIALGLTLALRTMDAEAGVAGVAARERINVPTASAGLAELSGESEG